MALQIWRSVASRWDETASEPRISGFDILRSPFADRPRIDVTLRVRGCSAICFPGLAQLFERRLPKLAERPESAADNPNLIQTRVSWPAPGNLWVWGSCRDGRLFGRRTRSGGRGLLAAFVLCDRTARERSPIARDALEAQADAGRWFLHLQDCPKPIC